MSGIMLKRKVAEKGYDCSKYRQFGTKSCHCHEVKENEEYKLLVSQRIKEIASTNNEMAREIVENTYKELENEKMQNISYIQSLLEKDEKKNLEEKINKLKNSIEYFDYIINSEVPNKIILQMIIDKIYIDSDKTIKFRLKVDINKMI